MVTSDNPRTEDPGRILDEILAGIPDPRATRRIVDRREAIRWALGEAGPRDTLLLAGKGHETYQVVGKEFLPFDEREIVHELVGRAADALDLDADVRAALALPPGEDGAGYDRIVTDTRTVGPGDLFVALAGERFDGHDFLAGRSRGRRAGCGGPAGNRAGAGPPPLRGRRPARGLRGARPGPPSAGARAGDRDHRDQREDLHQGDAGGGAPDPVPDPCHPRQSQ